MGGWVGGWVEKLKNVEHGDGIATFSGKHSQRRHIVTKKDVGYAQY